MANVPVVIASEADLLDQVAATQRRRAFLEAVVAGSAAVLLGCRPQASTTAGDAGAQPARRNPPARRPQPHVTPQPATCALTESNIEGPFFKPNAPRRSLLAPADAPGHRLSIAGRVRSASCGPLGGALLEVWHADHRGAYDNSGFGFRGIVATDAEGRFSIDTIAPGRYLNGAQYRPAHVHVKVHASGHRSLTTQLYFPNDPFNRIDPFVRDSLIAPVQQTYTGMRMSYDFVLAPART